MGDILDVLYLSFLIRDFHECMLFTFTISSFVWVWVTVSVSGTHKDFHVIKVSFQFVGCMETELFFRFSTGSHFVKNNVSWNLGLALEEDGSQELLSKNFLNVSPRFLSMQSGMDIIQTKKEKNKKRKKERKGKIKQKKIKRIPTQWNASPESMERLEGDSNLLRGSMSWGSAIFQVLSVLLPCGEITTSYPPSSPESSPFLYHWMPGGKEINSQVEFKPEKNGNQILWGKNRISDIGCSERNLESRNAKSEREALAKGN